MIRFPLSRRRLAPTLAVLSLGTFLAVAGPLGCGSDREPSGAQGDRSAGSGAAGSGAAGEAAGDASRDLAGGGAGDTGAGGTGPADGVSSDLTHVFPEAAFVQDQLEVRFDYESLDGVSRPNAGRATRPNVLLITLDTTRKDRLSLYGNTSGATPNLAALAEESVVFDQAFASAPTTLPSHTTVLTGLEPFEHGVRNNGIHSLAPEYETLAESVKALGYTTGAIVGAFPVAAQFGLDQGFDHYDDDFVPVPGSPVPQRSAPEVSRLGLSWIVAHEDEPWFCWLHYFDPHEPYAAPEPFQSLFPNPYEGELAYMDAHLGGLFRELKRQGLWRNTLVVITADHGEGLGDHREPTHSLFVYDATTSVPLLIRFPPEGPWENPAFRGRRVSSLVATTDITPTILDVLGGRFAPGATYPGTSLVPAIVQDRTVREVAYMETLVPQLDYGWSPYRAVVAEGHKFILAPRSELYDLLSDPGETVNLYEQQPERAQRLLELLAERIEHDHSAENLAIDEETVDKLRSLGYVAGGGASSTGPLPDAKDMLWALDAFDQARSFLLAKDIDRAGARLDQVLARDPKNRFARRMKNWILLGQGRAEEAEELARTLLREEPDAADRGVTEQRLAEAVLLRGDAARAQTMTDLLLQDDAPSLDLWTLAIRARAANGDLAGARAALAKAKALDASRVEPIVAFGNALEKAGKWEEAETLYANAVEVHGNQIDLLAGLASVDLHEGRAQEAANRAQTVVQADPTHAKGNYLLGALLVLTGKPAQATPMFVRAVATEPGNAEYQSRLGNHCLSGQNYTKAVEHLTRALALGKDDANTRAALGFAQAALGEKQEARANLLKALQQDPAEPLGVRIRELLATMAEPGSTATVTDVK